MRSLLATAMSLEPSADEATLTRFFREAHVQGVLAYQGSAPSDLNPDQEALIGKIKSSTTVDLFAGYDWGNYNVELFGTNIFDERNQIARLVVCSICTQVKIIPGRPRTIGLRLGAKF